MRHTIYHILTILVLCQLGIGRMQAQLIIHEDGTVRIGDSDSTHLYYKLDINNYHRLDWQGDDNYFVVLMDSLANDTVKIMTQNLLFRNYSTQVDNSVQIAAIYSLESIPGWSAKGYKKAALSGALDKTLGLKAILPSKSRSEALPRFSLSSVEESAPELLGGDDTGRRYMSMRSLVSMLAGAYQSLQAQSERLSEEVQALKAAGTLQEPATDIRSVVADADRCTIKRNIPNPFLSTTSVSVFIPEGIRSAILRISSPAGATIWKRSITDRGSADILIDGSSWDKGVYLCSLIADGTIAGTVKMMKR